MTINPTCDLAQPLSPKISESEIDVGLSLFLIRVYNYMGSGLVLTGLVAYAAKDSGLCDTLSNTPVLFWGVVLAPLVPLFLLSFRTGKLSFGAAQVSFWSYASLIGLSFASIFLVYTGISIAPTFFITAATFLATSLYGHTTRTDVTHFGSFLIMSLIGLIIASLVNVLLVPTTLQLVISFVGVIIVVGLTVYDTETIQQIYIESDNAMIADKKAIIGALALYLDFLNIWTSRRPSSI